MLGVLGLLFSTVHGWFKRNFLDISCGSLNSLIVLLFFKSAQKFFANSLSSTTFSPKIAWSTNPTKSPTSSFEPCWHPWWPNCPCGSSSHRLLQKYSSSKKTTAVKRNRSFEKKNWDTLELYTVAVVSENPEKICQKIIILAEAFRKTPQPWTQTPCPSYLFFTFLSSGAGQRWLESSRHISFEGLWSRKSTTKNHQLAPRWKKPPWEEPFYL